ncbi:uncharacterized protein NECHADRAFT_79577 [Fusarium vanettenii 77-13-4]|uniref:EKC/KEOPS complex subunit BUD32 n=1 Tax=Fusarium vanettenii (strain ATCC MYA-4622 / CBS 123669 / FGSC 9596 / NRRL 45880 / 77-13-4) TaxID=660122 RepID=C7Z7W1_FUSV7|nr:uncharacterized protein NECHADRAFT_79577 [Fusarium vanettenii 77-13-4]EEU39760.1 hypothetical protein NECHADRAFT_79577 [Fusarium vanettenii 77-13-4]
MSEYCFLPWYPRGIQKFLDASGSNYVALVDDQTVLKFPIVPPHEDASAYSATGWKYRRRMREVSLRGLQIEEKILKRIGRHERIVSVKGRHEDGLLLEYMPNGSVQRYLVSHPDTSLGQRLKWALQAAEGLTFVHSNQVVHCDITTGNLLLDVAFNIKIGDFEGMLLHPDGTVALDGGARYNTLSSMPRDDEDHCDHQTDRFALGTAIYSIMTGQRLFLDLDPVEEDDEVQHRFRAGEFPMVEDEKGGQVTRKCWMGEYESSAQVVDDIQSVLSASKSNGGGE